MNTLTNILKFIHVLGVVFMAAPLYSLIIVNERARLSSSMIYKVDRYMENIIKRQSLRCYIFQLTVLISGIGLVYFEGFGLSFIITNWILTVKTLLLLVLMGLLFYVHFGIQPQIEKLLNQINDDPVPDEIAKSIKPFRAKRKKLATVCLFLVITLVILGLQVYATYNPVLTVILIVLAGLFSWRVYKAPIPYGWI
ncbi:MAG: hypothetical protein ACE5WD_01900 [Candidatus Aminicenantia bacterium]